MPQKAALNDVPACLVLAVTCSWMRLLAVGIAVNQIAGLPSALAQDQPLGTVNAKELCDKGLNADHSAWFAFNPYKPYADEAKRRGFTVDKCRAELGLGKYVPPKALQANRNAIEDDNLLFDVVIRKRSADEIAITHRNKAVEFGGQITGRDTDGDATVIAIEDGTAFCRFTDTQQRLAVSRIGRGCWKWTGTLSRVSGGRLFFENCEFRACQGN